jgi:hypothetical protein
MQDKLVTITVRIPEYLAFQLLKLAKYHRQLPEAIVLASVITAIEIGINSLGRYKTGKRRTGIRLYKSFNFELFSSMASDYLPFRTEDIVTP